MEDPLIRRGWEDLANAIVLQALEDYERTCRILRRRPDLRERALEKRSLEHFFASRWFRTLSPFPLEELIRMKKEMQKE